MICQDNPSQGRLHLAFPSFILPAVLTSVHRPSVKRGTLRYFLHDYLARLMGDGYPRFAIGPEVAGAIHDGQAQPVHSVGERRGIPDG